MNHKPFDLSKRNDLARLAATVLGEIDINAKAKYNDGHRNHLGGSLIGDTCRRKLWYIFRWCKAEDFPGQLLRLFNRGHREEERNVEWLRDLGFTVWEYDESLPKKEDGSFQQFRISDCGGHFGGSLDGVVKFPERYGDMPYMLYECKTNGTNGFKDLTNQGMPKAKPVHWAQTCVYGYKMGLEYVLYTNTCKNNDEMHIEVQKLDFDLARHMISKAEGVIIATDAPARLSDNPTNFQCKVCTFQRICHSGDLPEVNCRSCKNAIPIDNAEWFCNHHQQTIPKQNIKEACSFYEPITV